MEKKKIRRLSDNLFGDSSVESSDEEIKAKVAVVAKAEVVPTDFPKYMQERNVTLKKLTPEAVYALGFSGLLLKPFKTASLANLLQKALA
jgi:hypothetical protein